MLRDLWRLAADTARARVLRRAAVIALALGLIGTSIIPTASAQPRKQKPAPLPPTTMPPLPTAQIDDTLAIGGQDIAAKKVRSRMTVAVEVNGRGPYRFVVDSGADTSVVGARVAAALALPAGTPVLLNGMTERSVVPRVLVDELKLGDSRFTNLKLPVLREGDLGGDGMIGIDALVEQRLMLDFEKRTITVQDATRPMPRFDGEIVVVARRRRGQLILTQVEAEHKPIEAVIDTGSEITIGNMALRDKLFRRRPNDLTKVAVTGVTGVTVDLELTVISELRLGPVLLRDVPIAFAEVPPFAVFGLSDKPALLLGTDLMETFRRVSLDFRARKVRFQLRRCEQTGVAISTHPTNAFSRLSTNNDAACRR